MRYLFFLAISLAVTSFSYAAEITAFPLQRAGEGAILVNGDIVLEDYENFLTKIGPYSSGVVIFNSDGGNLSAGINIGRTIRMRGFKTWVPSGSLCASACGMAWLGGSRRLMGKTALIGFHSASRMVNGVRVESGVGNAMYGAYLSQLGLSEPAILYLSSAVPTSMNWLTPAQARNLGIHLDVLDSEATRQDNPPVASSRDTMEKRAHDFVMALNTLLSGPSEKFIALLGGLYAEQVTYYGKGLPKSEVVTQISNFLRRWPNRVYAVKPGSMKVRCDGPTQCVAEGLIEFDAKSFDRNQRSHGEASFAYILEFSPASRWPVIVSESGSVVNRQLEALYQPSPGSQRDFGSQQ